MAIVRGTDAGDIIDMMDGVTNAADSIYGFGGNDTIFAAGGDDSLIGGSGADTLNGGDGNDTAFYWDSTASVLVSLGSGGAVGTGLGGTAQGDRLVGIENLSGSGFGDILVGGDGDNELAGLGGNDSLKGGGGDDTLFGHTGDDMLTGGAGADHLDGGLGIDTVYYTGSLGAYVNLVENRGLWGDAWGDTFTSIENVSGSDYVDTVLGDNGNNVFWGLEGGDWLDGGGGADTLWGGGNDDTLFGGTGADTLYGEAGNDQLIGEGNGDGVSAYNDILYGGAGNDRLSGGGGADILNGGDNDDIVEGDGGSDTLLGEGGADILDGGELNDIMIGGSGNDWYIVDNSADIVTEAIGGGTFDRVQTSATYVLAAGSEVELLETLWTHLPITTPLDAGGFAMLLAMGFGVSLVGRKLKLPNAYMLAPLLCTIALTASGVTLSSVPTLVTNAAQPLPACSLAAQLQRRFLREPPPFLAALLCWN